MGKRNIGQLRETVVCRSECMYVTMVILPYQTLLCLTLRFPFFFFEPFSSVTNRE